MATTMDALIKVDGVVLLCAPNADQALVDGMVGLALAAAHKTVLSNGYHAVSIHIYINAELFRTLVVAFEDVQQYVP